MSEPADAWQGSYFNYFTEIEEHFQKTRGTALFLLSPLDWALIESWKSSHIPMEAVLRGIDQTFEKWRGRKTRTQNINSLAYCAQAVLAEAQLMLQRTGGEIPGAPAAHSAPFEIGELRDFLVSNIGQLRARPEAAFQEIATTLESFLPDLETHLQNLEELEQRLLVLEERMIAAARTLQTEQQALEARRDLDVQLKPYRSRMNAQQIAMLDRQFLDRRLLEANQLPRLSLYYVL